MSTLLSVESGIVSNMHSVEMFGPPREAFEESRIVDHILQSFKGLDCSKCNKHFGYQDRADPDHLYCSHYCLTFGKYDLQQEFRRSGSSSVGCSGTLCESDYALNVPCQEISQSRLLQKPKSLRGLNSSSRGGHNTSRGGGYSLRSIRQQQNVDQSSFYTSSIEDSHHDIVDGSQVIKAPKVDIIAQVQDTMEQSTEKSSQSSSQSSSVVAPVVKEEAETVVPDTTEQLVITPGAKNDQDVSSSQKEIQSDFKATSKQNAKDTLTQKEAQSELKNAPEFTFSKPSAIPSSNQMDKTKVPRPTQSKPTLVPPVMKVIHNPDTVSTPGKPVGHQESPKQNKENLSSKKTADLPPKLMPSKIPMSAWDAKEEVPSSLLKITLNSNVEKKHWTTNGVAKSTSLFNLTPCSVPFIWDITQYQLIAKADHKNLHSLQKRIKKYCNEAPAMDRIPWVNDIVFAPYLNVYYRAKVTNVAQSSRMIDVEFLDYGGKAKVNLSDCREPEDRLMKKYPIYGTVFNLTLENEVPDSMKKSMLPQEIVIATDNEVFFILNNQQADNNEWTGKLCLSDSKTVNELVDDLINNFNKTHTDVESQQQQSSPSAVETPHPKWTMKNVKFSEHLRSGAHVCLSFAWNLSKLNMTAAEDANNLEYLQKAINDFVPNASGMTRTPEINEIVIAPYCGLYYRGRVSEINGTEIHVIFIDYGDSVNVKVGELKEPADDIMKHPVYGCCLKIANVSSDSFWIECQSLNDAHDVGGPMTIDNQDDPTLWIGQLCIQDKAWSALVDEAIKSQGK